MNGSFIHRFYRKLSKRRSWDDVSTGMVFFLGLFASLEAAYFTYVFGKFAPGFVDIANAQPLASWASMAFVKCVTLLSALGIQAFIWTIVAIGTMAVLQKRLFDV